jgi:predicted dehydrogenase
VVGLQARFSPQVQHAKQLIVEGYIGDVLSTSLVGSAGLWSGTTQRKTSYIFDESNGATPLSVSMLHALDALNFLLGDFETLAAASGVRTPRVRITDDKSTISATTPDQVAVCGKLKSGAIASVFYRGGQSRGSNFYWEINGSEGDLVFEANLGNLQVADARLRGGRGPSTQVADLVVPDPDRQLLPDIPSGMPSNVARLYLQFARDLSDGTHIAPDFDYAVTRHELIERIRRATQATESRQFDVCDSET